MYMVKFKGKFSEGQDKKLAATCFIKCCIKDKKNKKYFKKNLHNNNNGYLE